MDLVIDQVVKLQHVDTTDGDGLFESFARNAIQKEGLTIRHIDQFFFTCDKIHTIDADIHTRTDRHLIVSFFQSTLDIRLSSTIKNGCRKMHAEDHAGPAQMTL